MQRLAIFGATGSIGDSTLSLLSTNQQRYQVTALSGHNNIAKLAQLANKWQPPFLALTNADKYRELLCLLNEYQGEVLCGADSIVQLACAEQIDVIVAAVSGNAGLVSTYTALRAGKKVLIANKEPLVAAGDLMMDVARQNNASIMPLDSEHSAAWQCFGFPDIPLKKQLEINSLTLTASGGPFLDYTRKQMYHAPPEQACRHPNWSMGKKISVDSATLMNKGLEIIEACKLFCLDKQQIRIVIHKQSIVHCLVEAKDGSVLAQLSNPTMQIPIAKALGYPETFTCAGDALSLAKTGRLDFAEPDYETFPCLPLAFSALAEGGSAPLRLNAANETAVLAYLEKKIPFGQIAEVNERVMQAENAHVDSLESIIALQEHTRQYTLATLEKLH